MDLAEAVRIRVKEAGSLRKLAKMTGINHSYLGRICNGQKKQPKLKTLDRLGIAHRCEYWLKSTGPNSGK